VRSVPVLSIDRPREADNATDAVVAVKQATRRTVTA
jgi:hypothetical protein